METDGLLQRSSGTEDRRTRRVALTEKGHDLIGRGSAFARDNAAQMSQALSEAEETELKRLLAKLRDAGEGPLQTL